MSVTVYLDVFFLINAVLDGLLLALVRKILTLHTGVGRLLLAAAAGAAWACAAVAAAAGTGRWGYLHPAAGRTIWLLQCLGCAAAMVRIAFGRQKPRAFLRSLAVLLLAGTAAGGVFALADRSGQWSLAAWLCCAAAAGAAGWGTAALVREQKYIQKNLYEVTIDYQGNQVTVMAFLDTGNRLYEPYGHRPVHIIGKEAAARLCKTVNRVIYIPFSAVGTENGVLPAFQADRMEIRRDGAEVRCLEKPWLAVSREVLSPGRRYEMLLHGEESGQ